MQRLGNGKRDWLKKVEVQLRIDVARAVALGAWTDDLKDDIRSKMAMLHPDAAVFVEQILASPHQVLEGSEVPPLGSAASSSSATVTALQQRGSKKFRPFAGTTACSKDQDYMHYRY